MSDFHSAKLTKVSRRATLGVVVLSLAVNVAPVLAQSLADAAKNAEQERVKAKQTQTKSTDVKSADRPAMPTSLVELAGPKKGEPSAPNKVYTNDDLPPSLPTLPDAAKSPTSVAASVTDPSSEAYWRERRRQFDAKLHDDMAADRAALNLFISLSNPALIRRDPAAYLAAKSEVERTSAAVHYDVTVLAPALLADAKKAGVPEAWVQPDDR